MTLRAEATQPTIEGDVTISPVTFNTKGGSLTAILQRSLRGGLTTDSRAGFGAKLEFAAGVSCVLVAPGQLEEKIHVRRIFPNCFLIDYNEKEGTVIDPVIASTLSLIEEMVKANRLLPMDSKDTIAELRNIEEESDVRISAAQARSSSAKPSV